MLAIRCDARCSRGPTHGDGDSGGLGSLADFELALRCKGLDDSDVMVVYGNFDIIYGPSHACFSTLHHPHTPCDMLYFVLMLVGC